MPTPDITRQTFFTIEQEFEHLRSESSYRVPPIIDGFKAFLGSWDSWLPQGDSAEILRNAVVLPDPALNLSLPYPLDELNLAISVGEGRQPGHAEARDLAKEFVPESADLDRPISSLSGGERMLLSICKAQILAKRSEKVLLCSPLFWLESARRKAIQDSLARFPCAVQLFLLEGEDDSKSLPVSTWNTPVKSLTWFLHIDSPSVTFAGQTFPYVSPEKVIRFHADSSMIEFMSPTLITGANGLGKTTLAKLLSGLLRSEEGSIKAVTQGQAGCARLVLQDTLLHLFGDSVDDHNARVFANDKALGLKAAELKASLMRQCLDEIHVKHPGISLANPNHRTLLEAKISVAVERMFFDTPLIILDEPSWCLSVEVARALVKVVTVAAHERNIAVALISHQNWWQGLCRSTMRLSPTAGNVVQVEVTT